MKTVTNIEIKNLVNRTPKEIVEFFKAKGYTFSWDWQDTWQECHTKAFTVAKVMEMDILTDIRKEVENAIENGITLEQFKQNLEPVLAKKGWWEKKIVKNDENGLEAEVELGSNRRMKTIYETNLTTSYRAGQYKQQWENREARPNWMYVCKMLPTSREEHKALNGKVFPADDPFWETFYPPNGWGCKCDVIPLTDEELQGLSTYKFEPKLDKDGNQIVVNGIPQYKRVKSPIQMCHTDKDSLQVNEETVISNGVPLKYKTTSYIDPKTKQVTTTDRGWNYNVGKATYYEPDLSKYDDEFVAEYKKMANEFISNRNPLKSLISGNIIEIYDFDKYNALYKEALNLDFNKYLFDNTPISTNCIVESYDYSDYSLGDYGNNRIRISDVFENSLKRCIYKIKHKYTEYTKDEVFALTIYCHEWVHSVSKNIVLSKDKIIYREVLTEFVGREIVKSIIGIMPTDGGYNSKMEVFLKKKRKNLTSSEVLMFLKNEYNNNNIVSKYNDWTK